MEIYRKCLRAAVKATLDYNKVSFCDSTCLDYKTIRVQNHVFRFHNCGLELASSKTYIDADDRND